jgi:carbamoyl-phosphate synthase large subunit
MGIHTGDSITVAPAMTLSDTAYQKMRNTSIAMMRDLGNFAGGCNVQFALNPLTEDIIAIEINPRVSRSSALASKATGYPIAKIAAKLAIGYHLDELKNQITQTTSAYFEPALDYVIVKIPRWNFDKFKGANDTLGLQMKSVGEVMAIGRSFAEAVQKACQSLENEAVGLGYYGKSMMYADEIIDYLKVPKWDRIFRIKDALMMGVSVKRICESTGIDRWFIYQIQKICDCEKEIAKYDIDTLPEILLREAKTLGFSDEQIVRIMKDGSTDEDVYEKRKQLGITRVFKMVDTCSAEFEAKTPYFYSTFEVPPLPPPKGEEKRIQII